MNLPPELQQAIDLADSVLGTKNWIGPFYRNKIYRAFDVKGDLIGYRARTWLAILAARYSMAKWQGHYPELKSQSEMDRPKHWLFLAKGVVQEKIKIIDIGHRIKRFSQAIKKAQQEGGGWEANYAITAGVAALVALRVALGEDPFEGCNFTEEDVDVPGFYPTDYWDAALYAADAYAFQDYDDEAAFKFWHWWLTEAIPQAWELAQQP